MRRIAVALLLVLGGCSNFRLIPDNPIPWSNSFQPPVDAVVAGAVLGTAAWLIVDPTAPNWEIGAQRLDSTRVEIQLRKKRFSVGGDGEALALFRRHAKEIADKNGAEGYVIMSYSDEIESETTYARRVSRGVIRLLPPPA
jgi:hypothetical protein